VVCCYVEDATINEDKLFCKTIKRRATVKELFKIVDDFVTKKKDKIVCVGVWANAACLMAGNNKRTAGLN
jgi:hypothetical protein